MSKGKKVDYPLSDGVTRPYRLWDAKRKKVVRYRYYSNYRNAHIAGFVEARFADPGEVFDVYDARSGRMLGQYIRLDHSVDFMGPQNIAIKKG